MSITDTCSHIYKWAGSVFGQQNHLEMVGSCRQHEASIRSRKANMAESESDDEVYEDALEDFQINKSEAPDLEISIQEAVKSIDLFFKNRFKDALELMSPWAHCSMYHALGRGTLLFMQAMLTLESSEIEVAREALKQAVDVCNRRRRKNSIIYVTKMIKRPDYNQYTEEEIHAELCYAENLLLVAILTFVEDQSLVSFVKGGLRIRSCYHSYKECMHILENRKWEDCKQKSHFEGGVRMGIGAFNLMISQLPSKILKLLEFIGFSGNRAVGLREVEMAYGLHEGLRSPLCALVLVAYHTMVTYILGSADGDIDQSEKILNEMLEIHPKAALFIFFYGRVKQLRGNIDEAIETFKESISVQQEWKQFHYLCYWELLWCNCFKCDWEEAAKCIQVLRMHCRWSPAIYTYVEASVKYMIMMAGNEDLRDEIVMLMEKVPSLKQRLAGKSIPLEKYVVRKSQKFFSQDCKLLLPALELVYIWNSFPIIANAPHLAENMLTVIDKFMPDLPNDDDKNADDYCLALILRGMCLKCIGRTKAAEECFHTIVSLEKRIKDDTYLIPFAMTELGCMALDEGNLTLAKELLEPARHNYHNYPLETLLHFRVHSALRFLRSKGQKLNSTLTPSPQSTPLPSPEPSPIHHSKEFAPFRTLSPKPPSHNSQFLHPKSGEFAATP
ncbi:tetratricopeptide repeat protein 39B-like isoform X2 [Centruroides vittatus]|uniref:tetratricopeptide repeat protein 39B-like isoform X2 n=1 Tax=Centruroides vittatus TaxID=120091 RepID=UPI00350F0B0C